MLVLARRPNETIVIDLEGSRIVIKVLEIRNLNRVRLGIQAEGSVSIMRGELVDEGERNGRS